MRQAITLAPVESRFEQDESRSTAEFDLFWKELIPEGVWKHPTRGFTMKVDKVRMEGWSKVFGSQKEKSIRVPVPRGHSYSPEANAGFVEEIEPRQKENGKWSLFGLLNIPRGEDSDRINKTYKDVSVAISPSIKHSTEQGKVEDLGEGLEHVALTNYPVITGMTDFVAFDSAGETVTVSHLDLVDDVALGNKPDGFVLNPEQLKNYASEVARNTLAAVSVNQVVPKSGQSSGEKNMVTPEQLRSLEQKFSLEAGSLTEENWYETLNKMDLDARVQEKLDAEKKVEAEKLAKDKVEAEKLAKEKEAAAKLAKEKAEAGKFDINKAPEFIELQEQNQTLVLDRNQRRLGDVVRRLGVAQKSGRINKAAFDKMVTSDAQLQFSQETSVGGSWEAWVSGIEAQLSIIEQLPEGHSVSTTRQTAGHVSNELDQISDDEDAELDKEADAAIMSAVPQYHKENVKFDSNSGMFASVEQ